MKVEIEKVTNRYLITQNGSYSERKVSENFNSLVEVLRAQIRINGTQKHLGLFQKEEDAAMAYQQAVKK